MRLGSRDLRPKTEDPVKEKKMKVLIVDDKSENVYMLETLLKGKGYEVVSASNGVEALEKLRAEDFDMIIADILMPVMDGFWLCTEVKGDEKLKHIPFIFYTATYTDEKDEELALKIGADRFIRKPVDPDEFIKIIQGVIGDVEKGRLKAKRLILGEEKEISRLYKERVVKKLEKKMLDLEREITEREWAEKRVEHLNNVLRAIRGVNQLIIKEKRIDSLIKGTCDNIVKTRSYYNAWIVLLDENAKLVLTAETGLGENFLPIVNQLKRGKFTACAQKALKQSEVIATEDPISTCADCPLAKLYAGRGALTVRLEYNGKTCGLLSVSIPRDFVGDEEEQSLFKELAADIAFAIHALKLEEKNKQAQDALRQSERELRIRNQIAGVFLSAPDDEMYAGVLEIVLKAMESKWGIFGCIDEQGSWVCPSMTRDVWDQCQIPDKEIMFPREQWGDSIWGRAMVEKKTLYSNNKPFKVPKGHIPITRALDVPIIYQGKVIGNFLVGNKETDYDEKDKQLLESISNYIAPILHARLQRDAQEKDKKKLETRLRQVQKMEAIGTLAGGIAHDFNNILAAIIGYAEMVKMKLPEDSEVLSDLDQVLKSGIRAKILVQQILAFSREQELEQKPLQLKYIVKESLKLLRSTLPTDIEIKEDIAKDVGIVNADPTQMQQVIMNLCTNAGHAMQKRRRYSFSRPW
jgi:CheY-like chemotaxis protein